MNKYIKKMIESGEIWIWVLECIGICSGIFAVWIILSGNFLANSVAFILSLGVCLSVISGHVIYAHDKRIGRP